MEGQVALHTGPGMNVEQNLRNKLGSSVSSKSDLGIYVPDIRAGDRFDNALVGVLNEYQSESPVY